MYNRQVNLIMEIDANNQFVHRVSSYPVVASTIDQVWSLYSRCKESNDLIKYSLETAESGAKYVTDSAVPIVQKLPISSVNTLACSQLDRLEEKCPIIKKPTEEVVTETKKLIDDQMQPTKDRVNAITEYSVQTYSSVKDYSLTKARSMSDYGISTAAMVRDKSYETLSAAATSPYGKVVVDKLDGALEYVESYADKYLPEEKPVGNEGSQPIIRSGKARQRLYNRAMKELTNLQNRSKETADRLNFTVNLIDYARTNMDYVNNQVATSFRLIQDKPMHWWEEIRKEEDVVDAKEEEKPATFEYQAIRVARTLTKRIRGGLYSLNDLVIPNHLIDRFNSAKQFSSDLMWSFMKATKIDDLSDQILDQAKNQVAYIQETMNYLGDVAVAHWPLKQIVPEIQIDELDSESSDDDDDGVDGAHVEGAE